MSQELDELLQEENAAKEQIEENLKIDKLNRLAEFEDKLKASGSQKEFNKVLGEYQKAQLEVDQELVKQRQKELERLDRDMKARRAAVRARAKVKRDKAF